MRGVEKATKSAPWVAIVLALIGPLFGYLEVREVRRSARGEANEAKGATGVVYRLLVHELERQAADIDACHERVDQLAEALEEVTLATPLEMAEERPRSASPRLPTEAKEAAGESKLLGEALEEADVEDW